MSGTVAGQLSFGKILSRFLAGWDMGQMSLTQVQGEEKLAHGHGLAGSRWQLRTRAANFLATASSRLGPAVSPTESRDISSPKGEAGGDRAEAPSLATCSEAPRPAPSDLCTAER